MESLRHGGRGDQPALRQAERARRFDPPERHRCGDRPVARAQRQAAGTQTMTLSGELQAPQVNDLWQRRAEWWQDDQLELGGVTTLDSAGLALLVKWAKAVLARGATPQLVGASSDFYTLANLYGVAGLFQSTPLTTEDA
ncbi:anti-anti-sigma factor [Aeromonas sp. HMWF015]|nr:anti-anti-sigma factor [Aeromonas sp. HMWF015]